MRFFRRRDRPRPITEAEAYRRSYGYRTADVHVVKPKPSATAQHPRPRFGVLSRGERIRVAFVDKLTARGRPGA